MGRSNHRVARLLRRLVPDNVRLASAVGATFAIAIMLPIVAAGAKPGGISAGSTTLSVTGLSAGIAGAQQTITVTAQKNGLPWAGYVGSIAFTSSDPQAVLPAPYQFTGADGGSHTFSVTPKTAGQQSISATDQVTATIKGSASAAISAAAAATFSLSGLVDGRAGLPQALVLTVRDPFGNLATGYTGLVYADSPDLYAYLPPDHAFNAADGGVHVFAFAFDSVGEQTVIFNDDQNGLTVEASAQVTDAKAVAIVLTAEAALPVAGGTSVATAGVPTSITVSVVDHSGKVVPDYTGTVVFGASADGKHCRLSWPAEWVQGLIGFGCQRSYHFAPGDAGSRTFTGLVFREKRVYDDRSILTAVDAADPTITGNIDYFVLPGPAVAYSGCPAALDVNADSATFNQQFPVIGVNDRVGLSWTAVDAYGNNAINVPPGEFLSYSLPGGYDGTALVTTTDEQAMYTGSAGPNLVSFNHNPLQIVGSHSLAIWFRTGGTQSVTLTDTAVVNPLPPLTCSYTILGPMAFNGTITVADPLTTGDLTSLIQASTYVPRLDESVVVSSIQGPFNASLQQMGLVTAGTWPGTLGSPGHSSTPPVPNFTWDLGSGPSLHCTTLVPCGPVGPWLLTYTIDDEWGNTSTGSVILMLFSVETEAGTVAYTPNHLGLAVSPTVTVQLNTPVLMTVLSIDSGTMVVQLPGSGSTPVYAQMAAPSSGTLEVGSTQTTLLGYQPEKLVTRDGAQVNRVFTSVQVIENPYFPSWPYAVGQTSVLFNVCPNSVLATCLATFEFVRRPPTVRIRPIGGFLAG